MKTLYNFKRTRFIVIKSNLLLDFICEQNNLTFIDVSKNIEYFRIEMSALSRNENASQTAFSRILKIYKHVHTLFTHTDKIKHTTKEP